MPLFGLGSPAIRSLLVSFVVIHWEQTWLASWHVGVR